MMKREADDRKGDLGLELKLMRERLDVEIQEKDELMAKVKHLESKARM